VGIKSADNPPTRRPFPGGCLFHPRMFSVFIGHSNDAGGVATTTGPGILQVLPDFEIYELSHSARPGRDSIEQAAVCIRPHNARGELTVKYPPVTIMITVVIIAHQDISTRRGRPLGS
jgi:hypothetical protein